MNHETFKIRLGRLSELFGEKRETFRSMMRRAGSHLGDESFFGSGQQRTYSGADIVSHEAFRVLQGAGLSESRADDIICTSEAVPAFFHYLESEPEKADQIYLIDFVDSTGRRHCRYAFAEALGLLQAQAASPIIALKIDAAYRRAVERCAAAGLQLEGERLCEVSK